MGLSDIVKSVAAKIGSGGQGPVKTAERLPLEDLVFRALSGGDLRGAELLGHPVLFVNVASKCGLTPQYDGLQALYAKHRDQGFVIVGVPCNQFAGQESGSPQEIGSFCRLNYGVEFPLLEKQDVNGPNRSELYQYLIGCGPRSGDDISWNFEKFLVAKDGKVLDRFSPKMKPDDPRLVHAIEQAIA